MNRTASIQEAIAGVDPDRPEATPPTGGAETGVA